ncbi:MAG: NADH-quinone oxidoreductase subunit C [Ilumatobacteraceae bacterium]
MSDATTETEPAALPGDGLREGIVDELRRRIGESLVDVHLVPNDDLWVRIATDSWRAAGEAVEAMGFHYFCFLSAIDWMPSPYGRSEDDPTQPPPERDTVVRPGVTGGETRFQVFARVTDTRRHVALTLKVDVPDDVMAIESWFTVYAGANWHERETHEMFGISFVGHPDLRNMYLPTEFEGHPLRKDFPLLARMIKPWPGIVDVEPMPVEDALPQDEVVGAQAPADLTPEQSDAGLGAAPAEDRAVEEALTRSVEEAPDHTPPPAGDDARVDSGDQQDLLEGRPDPSSPAPAPPEPGPPSATSAADETARVEPDDELVVGEDDIVDETEVRVAEGNAVTEDEATATGRPADDQPGEGAPT